MNKEILQLENLKISSDSQQLELAKQIADNLSNSVIRELGRFVPELVPEINEDMVDYWKNTNSQLLFY